MIYELAILMAGAGLVMNARASQVVVAYVVLAALATLSVAPAMPGSPLALALLVFSAVLKLIVAPVGVTIFVLRNPAARDLRPSVSLPWRLVAVVGCAVAAQAVARLPAFEGVPDAGIGAYAILCALGMLVIQRNLIAHVLGLLALSAGVTFAAAALAPGLPESVELGATFDALVVTFIGLALARAFIVHVPLLDVESLRRLRG